jgi:peptidoglycan/xylan/chitin deacetylase (PgdA/CDA1 family)
VALIETDAPRGAAHTARWVVKKLARGGMAVATGCGGGARREVVRVLTYHRFGDRPRDPFCISPRHFAEQMRRLARARRAVSLADLRAFLAADATLPEGAVLVTVDDGCACLWREALPILREFAIPAVAFIPAGAIDANRSTSDALLTPDQLARLPELGVAIGSHSWSHRPLARLPAAQIADELSRSRAALEGWTGRRVDVFAYPFGRRGDFSDTTEQALRAAGYSLAFTAQHGAVRRGLNPLVLPRIKIEAGEPAWLFERACGGGLDAWRVVDQLAWRWQQEQP